MAEPLCRATGTIWIVDLRMRIKEKKWSVSAFIQIQESAFYGVYNQSFGVSFQSIT